MRRSRPRCNPGPRCLSRSRSPPADSAAPPPPPVPSGASAGEKANGNGKKENGNGKKKDAPKYEFKLGNKCESIVPCTHGDAKVEEGKVETTTEDNTLKTVLTGGAGANVFLGVESSALQAFQVVQEFEITCSDPKINQVVLTLESNLAGFIRSKHKASACVKLAGATITPVGCASTPLAVCYPALCVSGATCNPQGYKYETPQDPAKTPQSMPLGQYVLQANFVIEVTAGGLLDAHSTAIFVPESEALDPWEREHDPYKGDSHDDYGFTLTLKAETPPGFPSVAKAKKKKQTPSLSARTPDDSPNR